MDRLFQDLRLALRLLWKDRNFTVTTITTLALCLAANAAIFAIVQSIVLRPLPFPDSDRILTMYNAYPKAGVGRGSNGVPDYYDRLRDMTVFEELALYDTSGMTLAGQGSGQAQRVDGMEVTPSFFRLLRVDAVRGRLFTEDEAEPGKDRKVVLSHGLWQRAFGGRDAAIGDTLRLNGEPHLVIGVLPRDFRFLDTDAEVWVPVAFTPEEKADDRRHSNNWQMIGRLKPGATIAQAQAQVDAINARNLERFPGFRQILVDAGFHTPVFVFQDELVATARPVLLLLWGGVLVVLLIGCVNVANLVSVRATARGRELVTRMALGAGLGRITQQILTESLVISTAGGIAGLALGWWGLKAAPYLGLDQLPRGNEIALDATAIAYMFTLVTLVGVIVGLVPVMTLRHARLAEIVREERIETATRGVRLLRRGLVITQVAFALVLLVGAGLLLASFQKVLAVDPGFRPEGVLTGTISLPESTYAKAPERRAAFERILEAVRAVPAVRHAGITSSIPFGGSYSDSVILADGYTRQPGESLISPSQVVVSDGYMEAMGFTVVEGRTFEPRDTEGAPRVIIIDERLARKFWPGTSALGRYLYFPESAEKLLEPPPKEMWMQVIGVVKRVTLASLTTDGASGQFGAYYLPQGQAPRRTVTLAIRAGTSPASLLPAVRSAVAAIDPTLPVFNVRTMAERVDQALVDRRTPMLLGISFGAVALFLCAVGLYGTLAYQVSQRRHEIGIRMALGASTSSIFGMVLREGGSMVAIGAVLGLAGAFLLRRTLEAQLFGVGAFDPGVIAGVATVLAVVAVAACLVPARSAARTDPVRALVD